VTVRCRVLPALLAVVFAVATVAIAAAPAPVAAQSATPTFVLGGQSPWVAPGAGFLMRFDATNVPPGAEVALTVHDALGSRTAFDQSIDGTNLPTTRDRQTFPFDQLPVDAATGQRVLAYPTSSLGTGVFPIEVDLRSASDDSLAHFVTHVVVAPVGADGTLTAGQPLNVAWVWPLQTEPGYVASSPNVTTIDDVSPAGRLGRQATELAANPDVPLTLAPSPETLDAWNTFGSTKPELFTGAAAIRAAFDRGDQVLAGPFVPLDLPSIQRADLTDVVNPELSRGIATLQAFFGPGYDANPSTALPGPLDPQSVSLLQSASVRQLVVDGDALSPVTEKYTPAHPYKMRTAAGDDASAVTVVATDPGLEQFLTGDQPPALRAAHLLAGLAVIAGEQPSIARGVAIANPTDWNADSTFVTAVLAGLRGNPMVKPTTVGGLLQAVPTATVDDAVDGPPVYRQLQAYTPPATPVSAAQYANGAQHRQAVEDLVGATDPRTLGADRALASSVTSEWANADGRKQASALLDAIGLSVKTYLDKILVQPNGSTITITSSTAEIPISFNNTGDDDITVHLQLDSDHLLFPEGATRDVFLPRHHNTTVRIAVETRGSGTAPLQMTVTTQGGLPIPDNNTKGVTTIKVRSSFVSGVGVFLTVGAIVFLALWWGWDIHRRRKQKSREKHPTYRLAPPSGQPA
jgi:hypothetical protein